MKILLRCTGLCSLLLVTAMGCHSSSAAATTASTAKPVPQPTPVPAPPATPKKLVCTGIAADDAQGADFVETSALYMLMNGKLGGWSSCAGKKLGKTDEEVLVTFVGGATLTLSSYPSSDAAAQEAVLPAGTSITREDVIKALQTDQPPDGCGVDWSKLSAGGPGATGDFKASGTTCTLDLHIKMAKGSVVGFGFGVAA